MRALPIALASALTLPGSGCGLRATRAYVHGYPLVLLDETRRGATEVPLVCGLGAPTNQFAHLSTPPGPDFRAVVRPNVDTLYSSAFLDLSGGPVGLEMPGVSDRYVFMAVLDGQTENVAGLGTMTHGEHPGRYLFVGPDGIDEVPPGTVRVDVPTQHA